MKMPKTKQAMTKGLRVNPVWAAVLFFLFGVHESTILVFCDQGQIEKLN
jgi:hypothetical protein